MTQKNVASILKGWPQAISADDGDLRILHDMANSGAGEWVESLFWPDYLWLSLDGPEPPASQDVLQRVRVHVGGPVVSQPDADLGEIKRGPLRPSSGCFPLSGRIDCLIELKAILVDYLPKLRRYQPRVPWPVFLDMTLRQAFSRSLAHADEQIRDGRRLLGLSGARGVSVIINEGSPSLDPDVVHAFLAREIQRFPHTDAVVYLSDRRARYCLAAVLKDSNDAVVQRFAEEFAIMLKNVAWDAKNPTIKGGPYPKLTIRIEMDERSREMYRTWSTGWRFVDDPRPRPVPMLKMHIVTAEEFQSGLS